jgi:hypothetical protein
MEPCIELGRNRCDRLGSIDHEPTFGICRCQRQKRFPNPFVEAVALLFESIGWPIDPGEADAGGDIKKHVHIGPRVTDRELGQAEYGFDAKRSTSALVRQRGADVSITDNVLASVECGANHLVDMLGSVGRHQQRLGSIGQASSVWAQQQFTNRRTDLGAARLTGEQRTTGFGYPACLG